VPEIQFDAIIFSLVCAISLSAGVLVYLKKAAAARRKTIHFPTAFLGGAVLFVLIYFINRLTFPDRPKTAALVNLALLSCVLALPKFKKKPRHRRLKAAKHPQLRVEAAALKRMLQIDPLNAFCFEKLSEIYEKMGKPGNALHAAREAIRLAPTVENKSRLEELKRKGYS